ALAKRRHRKDVSIAVSRLSGPHRLPIGCPMTLAKVFRHNEVKGTSDCFLCRVTENSLGAAIPEPDQTAEVRVNDGVGSVMDQSPTEAVDVESDIVGSRHD